MQWIKTEAIHRAQHIIMSKTAFKYTLMRIRSKLSYQAYLKKMTIPELIISQCLTSYNIFLRAGIHKNYYNEQSLRQFRDVIHNENNMSVKTALLMKLNIMEFGSDLQKQQILEAQELKQAKVQKG